MKVIGFDNAVLEYYTGKCIESEKIKKGTSNACSWEEIDSACEKVDENKLVLGGSVTNVMYGLNLLGIDTALMGVIGNDDYGKLFKKGLKELGIKPHLTEINEKTGLVITSVSDDGERAFIYNCGASNKCSKEHLQLDKIEEYNLLHLSAYTIVEECVRGASETLMKKAKEFGLIVSFDLAAPNIVEENKDWLGMY